jgi:enoyl-CoA hydratase
MDVVTEPVVLEASHGSVRVLTLNRPDKMNAFNASMHTQFAERLLAIEADETVRAVILTGAGRAFSAGGDRALLNGHLAGDMPDADEVLRASAAFMACLTRLDIPVIAAVNGPTLGMAVGIVAMCDLVIMGEDSYLCENHAQFGMGTGAAVARTWRGAGAVVAKELLMTASRVGPEEAVRMGLANRVVPRGQEVAAALEVAERIAAMPRSGPALMKHAVNAGLLSDPEPRA